MNQTEYGAKDASKGNVVYTGTKNQAKWVKAG